MLKRHMRVGPKESNIVVANPLGLSDVPSRIEAFFYIKGDVSSRAHARKWHDSFQGKYPDSYAPLLSLDMTRAKSDGAIFEASVE